MKSVSKMGLFAKLGPWIGRHKLTFWIIVSAVLACAAFITTVFLLYSNPKTDSVVYVSEDQKPEPKFYSPLTGLEIEDEQAASKPVTAVIIENSPEARPQSGLKEAEVIFEAIAEGGITRFLIFYQQSEPELIGPVRSLRMYYIDWLVPFDASIAHIGGSAAALKEIRNGKYKDLDQFFNAQGYWRATDRWAPHNVYTNYSRLSSLNKAKNHTSSNVKGFERADSKPAEEPNATTVNINISSALFNSSYAYDSKANNYKRSQGGGLHKDREKGQISPNVVIAMMVNEVTVMEDGWRQSITTNGSGKAYVFQNGTVHQVTWKKTSRASQIQFIDSDGEVLKLARGQTWITAVPKDGGSVSWK